MFVYADPTYTQIREWTGLSDQAWLAVAMNIHHSIVFFGFVALYSMMAQSSLFSRWLIRPQEKQPSPELVRKAYIHAFVVHFVTEPVLLYLSYPLFLRLGVDVNAPLPPLHKTVLSILFFMAVEDTMFYWTHRALHHPRIYKYIHKQHHTFINSIGVAAEYAHPIEYTFGNVLPFFAGPLILGAPLSLIMLWNLLRIWETIDHHSGLALPFSPWNMLTDVLGGPERHDYHHSHNVGSYGSFTTFWDWAMGTDQAFKKWKAKQAEVKNEPAKKAD